MFGDNLFESFAQRRPAYRDDGICGCLAHGVGAFNYQENLHIVTGFCQRKSMNKGERMLGLDHPSPTHSSS
jgi:hypothetical protein